MRFLACAAASQRLVITMVTIDAASVTTSRGLISKPLYYESVTPVVDSLQCNRGNRRLRSGAGSSVGWEAALDAFVAEGAVADAVAAFAGALAVDDSDASDGASARALRGLAVAAPGLVGPPAAAFARDSRGQGQGYGRRLQGTPAATPTPVSFPPFTDVNVTFSVTIPSLMVAQALSLPPTQQRDNAASALASQFTYLAASGGDTSGVSPGMGAALAAANSYLNTVQPGAGVNPQTVGPIVVAEAAPAPSPAAPAPEPGPDIGGIVGGAIGGILAAALLAGGGFWVYRNRVAVRAAAAARFRLGRTGRAGTGAAAAGGAEGSARGLGEKRRSVRVNPASGRRLDGKEGPEAGGAAGAAGSGFSASNPLRNKRRTFAAASTANLLNGGLDSALNAGGPGGLGGARSPGSPAAGGMSPSMRPLSAGSAAASTRGLAAVAGAPKATAARAALNRGLSVYNIAGRAGPAGARPGSAGAAAGAGAGAVGAGVAGGIAAAVGGGGAQPVRARHGAARRSMATPSSGAGGAGSASPGGRSPVAPARAASMSAGMLGAGGAGAAGGTSAQRNALLAAYATARIRAATAARRTSVAAGGSGGGAGGSYDDDDNAHASGVRLPDHEDAPVAPELVNAAIVASKFRRAVKARKSARESVTGGMVVPVDGDGNFSMVSPAAGLRSPRSAASSPGLTSSRSFSAGGSGGDGVERRGSLRPLSGSAFAMLAGASPAGASSPGGSSVAAAAGAGRARLAQMLKSAYAVESATRVRRETSTGSPASAASPRLAHAVLGLVAAKKAGLSGVKSPSRPAGGDDSGGSRDCGDAAGDGAAASAYAYADGADAAGQGESAAASGEADNGYEWVEEVRMYRDPASGWFWDDATSNWLAPEDVPGADRLTRKASSRSALASTGRSTRGASSRSRGSSRGFVDDDDEDAEAAAALRAAVARAKASTPTGASSSSSRPNSTGRLKGAVRSAVAKAADEKRDAVRARRSIAAAAAAGAAASDDPFYAADEAAAGQQRY